ncbi:MAG: RNB domain-containing ribonuclease [Nocardioides sp.]|uniref:RNB domain-containing ribonuclease n=1 Tax=Nocardioides sp. TaxID=35761 RepID=UPI003EFD0AFF
MPSNRVLTVRPAPDSVLAEQLRTGIEEITAELGVQAAFPDEVERVAAASAASPRLPELDRTDLEFVTIDPPGARDLDQALHIERAGDGFRVHYAIADLGAFITPGDAVDLEANRRGETLYGASSKIPLHPKAISEDAGSLLPDAVRPAVLWTIDLDAAGATTAVRVERALVRSRAQLDYESVQEQLDAGTAPEVVELLREVGELRIAQEQARGGVSLPLPEQEIAESEEHPGHLRLSFRGLVPVEDWNAQISLLTGMAAASLMVGAKVGLLRTLPPAQERDVERLRRTARALRIEWARDVDYPAFVRSLDPTQPHHAAMVVACTRLLRGSGYAAFDGELPEQTRHAAIAAEYAHVTAPLRRLVDRYATEVCLAVSAGEEVPAWVRVRLPALPEVMRESGRRANSYENAILNLAEAELLQSRVGESFEGVVLDADEKTGTRGTVTITDPAIEATVTSESRLPVGEDVTVTLVTADPVKRKVEFALG